MEDIGGPRTTIVPWKLLKNTYADHRDYVMDYVVPSLWVCKNRFIKNAAFQFSSKKDPSKFRPWAIAPIDDMSKTVAVKKARQMGVTELFISRMVYMSSLLRCRTVYALPKDKKAKEISNQRMKPLGTRGHPDAFHGEVLERIIPGWRGVLTRSIVPRYGGGTSDIIITGSWNEDLGESTAADIVNLDEFDRHKPGVISAFRESLAASRIGQLRLFSTPTFPGMGVDGQFEISDKCRWVYKCTKCGFQQYLTRANIAQRTGPDSLIQRLEAFDDRAKVPDGTFSIVCVKCQEDLDRWNAKAQWVPERTDGELRGYSISQLDCMWITADMIMRKLREHKIMSKWVNYNLGEAYAGETGPIASGFVYTLVDADIKVRNRAQLDAMFKNCRVSIGGDWGGTNYGTVLATTPDRPKPIIVEVFKIVSTDNVDELVAAIVAKEKQWAADIVVTDFGYGQDRNPKLYKALACQFWGCLYPPVAQVGSTSEPIFGPNKPTEKVPYPLCRVGRAPSLEDTLRIIRQGGIIIGNLPDFEESLDDLDVHFGNVVLDVEELPNGLFARVAVTTGPDHYLHALNYAMIGQYWLKKHSLSVNSVQPYAVPGQGVEPTVSGVPTGAELEDIYGMFGYLDDLDSFY
jgi:hypothetical protein